MITTIRRLALSLAFVGSMGFDASAAVSVSATPGMDYKGATIAVTGVAGSTAVAVRDYKDDGALVFMTNITADAAFLVDQLVPDGVYDITAATASLRLYQGEAGYGTETWFTEPATSPSPQQWTASQPTVKENRFVFADDADELVATVYTPEGSQSDRLAVVETDVTFGGAFTTDDMPASAGAQAAFTLVADANDVKKFAYLANGEWTVSEVVVEEVAETVYTVRTTLDRMNKAVRYEVRAAAGDFVTIYDGGSSSVASGLASVGFSGEGTVGTIDGANSIDKADAWICEADKKYKSINAAIDAGQTSMELLWDASWAAPETGAAYAISGGRTLKVLSGKIAAGTTLPGNVTLVGGKYTTDSWQGAVASGYRMAGRVSSDDYKFEVLQGATPIAADEKVYPVTDGTKTVDIAFSQTELTTKGIGVTAGMDDSQVQDKLNALGSNSNRAWENVVLGLDNNDANAIPVVKPVQSADATKISLALGGVKVDAKSNANVVYAVYASDTVQGVGEKVSEDTAYNAHAAVALPDDGVKYYTLKVVAKGAM